MGVCVSDRQDALVSVPVQADVASAQPEGRNMSEEVVVLLGGRDPVGASDLFYRSTRGQDKPC